MKQKIKRQKWADLSDFVRAARSALHNWVLLFFLLVLRYWAFFITLIILFDRSNQKQKRPEFAQW